MSICADDDSFGHYKSGVLNDANCCTNVDHDLMITGYGSDPELGDYWIVKNSWGLFLTFKKGF